MRFNALFFTSTILFVASIDASSTKVDQHELQRFLRGDTKPHQEERVTFAAAESIVSESSIASLSKIAEDVSNFDRRGNAEYNLLKTEDYKKLYEDMATASKTKTYLDTHVATVLAAKLGNDRFARILQASRNDPVSKQAAARLQMGLMRSWENEGVLKSASGLFNHLFPPTTGEKVPDDLLRNPLFDLWFAHEEKMMRRMKQNLFQETTKILEARYGTYDVAMMLEASAKAADTSIRATRLRFDLLEEWARNKNISFKDVFNLFKIGDIAVDDLLDSPAFRVVYRYSFLYREHNPDSHYVLINAITVDGKDASVAKMLDAATANEGTKHMAKRLQNLQFTTWLDRDDQTIKKMLEFKGDNEKPDPAGTKVWEAFRAYTDLKGWIQRVLYSSTHSDIPYDLLPPPMTHQEKILYQVISTVFKPFV